jgi:hypothetical protein
MLPDISHDRDDDVGLDVPVTSEQLARQQAIRQIGRRRRFWFWAAMGTLLMIIVTASWAFSQYHDAGGWPTHGFTQSSWPPVPNVWNDWIIWPAMVWALATAGYAWFVFGNKPISEGEIEREIDRQAGRPTPTADEKKVR